MADGACPFDDTAAEEPLQPSQLSTVEAEALSPHTLHSSLPQHFGGGPLFPLFVDEALDAEKSLQGEGLVLSWPLA